MSDEELATTSVSAEELSCEQQEVTFKNELGNQITMRVKNLVSEGCVLVYAEGPTSLTTHVWTVQEAFQLKTMLEKALS